MRIDDKLKSMGFDEGFIKKSLSKTKLKDKEITEAIYFVQTYNESFTIKLVLNHKSRKLATYTYSRIKFEREIRDYKLNKILNDSNIEKTNR